MIRLTLQETLDGESKTLEFKVNVSENSKQHMKAVVAFSNSAGGKIIIGVDDKSRKVIGVPEMDSILVVCKEERGYECLLKNMEGSNEQCMVR